MYQKCKSSGWEGWGGYQLICYLFLYVSMEGEKDMEAGEPRGVEVADSGGHVTNRSSQYDQTE